MKRKRRPEKPSRPASQHGKTGSEEGAVGPPISPRRRILFRIVAATFIPALLLVLLELGLRVAGYGYPTALFVPTTIRNQPVLVENHQFGRRFFPLAMARTPSPVVFPRNKGTNTYRVFVLGESAALGDPEPAFGVGRYLEVLLRERFPRTRFEVISAAVTAVNSHALLPVARECAKYDGDLWILYIGNNEVVGPFGGGTVLGRRAPPLWIVRATLALKRLRTGQLVDELIQRLGPDSSSPKTWGGMQMFLGAQTRPQDPARKRTVEHFRSNLKDILEVSRRAGIKTVVSTIASNLKDCPPFASLHSDPLADSLLASWKSPFALGLDSERAGDWQQALEAYNQAAAIDAQFAELQFRLARCYLALSNAPEALRCFERARDCDALAFRADSPINQTIRATADRFRGEDFRLIDAAQLLAQASPQEIPGKELFYEHVHLTFNGNYLLARAFAEQVALLLPPTISKSDLGHWASAEACETQLCVSPWDRQRLYQNILQRQKQPPFTMQIDADGRLRAMLDQIIEQRDAMTLEAAVRTRQMYLQALERNPQDFHLRGNLAKFLEDNGNYEGAVAEWKQVQQLLPYHFGPHFYLGKALARSGQHAEAEKELRTTIRMRPDAVEAIDELGELLAKLKRPAEAVAQFEAALRIQPANARIHLHLADALAAQNRRDEAVQSLRRAVELRPDYWEARYLLGVELALRGELRQASLEFAEVLRVKPDHALAHLNLGVALAKQNQLQQAKFHFSQTLKLDPRNQAAREYLNKLEAVSR